MSTAAVSYGLRACKADDIDDWYLWYGVATESKHDVSFIADSQHVLPLAIRSGAAGLFLQAYRILQAAVRLQLCPRVNRYF